MRRIKLYFGILFLFALPQGAWAIEGYSGSMWGIGIYDTLESNPKTLGSIRQGIDWIKIYDAKFSTYTKFRYRFEREESEFFNAYGPGLGVSVKRGPYRLGWEYLWERFPERNRTDEKSQFYFEWYFGWDLKDFIR